MYTPGLHLLINLHDVDVSLLSDHVSWQRFVSGQVAHHQLKQVGEVIHPFPGAGFTSVHALTESHLSIHTWPEYRMCTCDVFLSSFRTDNSERVRAIGRSIVAYFSADRHDWIENIR